MSLKASTLGRVAFLQREGDSRLNGVAAHLVERGFDIDVYADESQARAGMATTPPDLVVVSAADRAALDRGVGDARGPAGPPLLVLSDPIGEEETGEVQDTTRVFVSAIERIFANDKLDALPDGSLQRLASVGLVASSVAHELSSPLSSLWMDLTMLRKAMEDAPALHDTLDAAFDAVERMRTIIADMREVSVAGDSTNARSDMRAVLDRSLRLLRPKLIHATIERDYLPAPLVPARDGRLTQLFVNLLSNAADALPDDDPDGRNVVRVTIRTGSGGNCVVEVHDNGCGIAEEALPHIFKPFFTTKERTKGSGLGLALCQGVVRSLGGTIEVESRPSWGTTFRVTLPSDRNALLAGARIGDVG